MKKIVLVILVIINIFYVCPQKDDIYNSYTYKNYRKSNELNQTIDFENIDYNLLNAAVFFATNAIRIKHKLNPVKYVPLLEKSAQLHAKDMVEKNFFSHTNRKNKKKKEPNDRARFVGIINPFIAENIATTFGLKYKAGDPVYIIDDGIFSYKSGGTPILPHTYVSIADVLIENWMNSPGHRKNILSDKALELGCGSYIYIDSDFNNMPMFKAVQNFQWYEPVKS